MNRSALGKLAYGLLFCVVVPAGLIWWAQRLESLPWIEAPESPIIGTALAGSGLALIIAGMDALWRHGKGLPMNAYPPEHFVGRGVYKWVFHPIYLGFIGVCIGVSLAFGSAPGLWLVTPVTALAITSLVWGYERPDLIRRFGDQIEQPWLRLPQNDEERPETQDVAAILILVFLPWLTIYMTIEYLGVIPPILESTLGFERDLPGWAVWTVPYTLAYPFVLFVPWIAHRKGDLRDFAIGGLLASALVFLIYMTVPTIAPFRPIDGDGFLVDFLKWQQSFDTPATAFPAFHVIWILLASVVYVRSFPNWRVIITPISAVMCISCWATGFHALLDIIAGAVVFVAVICRERVQKAFLNSAEWIANSWSEWNFGPVRVINHGLYAAMAAIIGFLIVGYITGGGAVLASIVIGVSIVIGAGIWGQILVGSASLQRPFGYYGSILGGGLGVVLVQLFFNQDELALGAALAVAAPWVQAIGRMRCLVQGCCHGAPTSEKCGIHYFHEKSRVLRISGLGGEPLHPTPLYSMAGNIVSGLILFRLLQLGAPTTLIIGIYLILNGLARFSEEAYRGEVQTQIIGGLRIYQWAALSSFLVGIGVTAIPSAPVATTEFGFSVPTILGALFFGIFVFVAMGVDFPHSKRRFSKLI